MRYHSSKDGEYRSVGAPQTSTNAGMRTLPKGTSDALRAELLTITKKDEANDMGTIIMAQSPPTKADPSFAQEAGWRSGTLAAYGAEETPEQARVAALRQATRAMHGYSPVSMEIMHSRAHPLHAAAKDAFRPAEERLQESLKAVKGGQMAAQ